MNDMGDFAKGFKTMSVEELFYRGDGDGDKNNIEGKYDKDCLLYTSDAADE